MRTLSCHHEFSVNLNWSGKKNKTKQKSTKNKFLGLTLRTLGLAVRICTAGAGLWRKPGPPPAHWQAEEMQRIQPGPAGRGGLPLQGCCRNLLHPTPRGEGLCLRQLSSSGKWSLWSAHASSWGAPGDPSLNAFYLPLCESSFLIWVGKEFMCKVHIKKIWRIVMLQCWVKSQVYSKVIQLYIYK